MEMREIAFGVTRDTLSTSEPNKPFAVVMETGLRGGTFTLVALADGNASIYFSSGGGFIGGFSHASIRDWAIECVKLAGEHVSAFVPANNRRLPAPGETIFHVLTDTGVLTASAPEIDLGEKRHPLWPVFHSAHEVIAGYRMLEQSKET